LRKSSDFPVVFIRFIGTLATNMNLLHNSKTTSSFANQQHIFEEVFDMTESLIRLLRIPTISANFVQIVNTKSDSSSNTTTTSSSYFGILNWIFQDELMDQPPPPPPPNPNNSITETKKTTVVVEESSPNNKSPNNKSVSVSAGIEDHDGNMLTLSWRTVNNIFPSFSNLLSMIYNLKFELVLLKIRTHSLFEINRFSNVDDLPLLIQKLIHPRVMRQGTDFI
jgi:hypothetical protein